MGCPFLQIDLLSLTSNPCRNVFCVSFLQGMEGVYGRGLMDLYRQQGEDKMSGNTNVTGGGDDSPKKKDAKAKKSAKPDKKGGKLKQSFSRPHPNPPSYAAVPAAPIPTPIHPLEKYMLPAKLTLKGLIASRMGPVLV